MPCCDKNEPALGDRLVCVCGMRGIGKPQLIGNLCFCGWVLAVTGLQSTG